MVRLKHYIALQLNGDIPEQKGGRFSPPLSIPQLKEALEKAAYDPRIRGIHLKIGSVSAGWAKLQVSPLEEHLPIDELHLLGWHAVHSLPGSYRAGLWTGLNLFQLPVLQHSHVDPHISCALYNPCIISCAMVC